MKKIIFNLLIIYIYAYTDINVSLAQSNQGTEFWVGFMDHFDASTNSKETLIITSEYNTSGFVECSGCPTPFLIPFTVNANEAKEVFTPNNVEVTLSDSIQKFGIKVTAQDPIIVYAHQYGDGAQGRADAALILSKENLGNEYFVASYYSYVHTGGGTHPSEFLIIGTEDSTSISIYLTDSVKNISKDSVIEVLLNKGESYQIKSVVTGTTFDSISSEDFTGTRVIGNKDFAFFSGNKFTRVSWNGESCSAQDNLYEQMYPVSSWGRNYYATRFSQKTYDILRIISSTDSTLIYIDGNIVDTLDQGEFYQYQQFNPVVISSNNPILCAQYSISRNCENDGIGDPSMVLLSPLEQFISTTVFSSSQRQFIDSSFVNIVCRTKDINTIQLDNNNIASNFSPFPNDPNFSHANIKINFGKHNIVSEESCAFSAIVYGFGSNVESYAYLAGGNFNNLEAIPDITFSSPDTVCTQELVSFVIEGEYTSYVLKFGDGDSTIIDSTHIYDTEGMYILEITFYTDFNCNSNPFTFKDTIVVLPNPGLNIPSDKVCIGNDKNIGVPSISGFEYLWRPGNSLDDSTISNPIFSPEVTTTFYVNMSNNYCSNDDTVFIEVGNIITFIPNAISPNGDENNDELILNFGGCVENIHFAIYNRFGKVVFETFNPEEKWDGHTKNGDIQYQVFTYVINASLTDGSVVEKKGNITVIK